MNDLEIIEILEKLSDDLRLKIEKYANEMKSNKDKFILPYEQGWIDGMMHTRQIVVSDINKLKEFYKK